MTESDIKNYLQLSKPFHYLEPEELDMLLAYSKTRSFAPGEILLQQGQKSEGMYIILQGQVLVTARVLGQGTVNLATLNPGDFLGEVSLIEKGLCTATVSAINQTQGLLVPRSYFDMLPTFFPQIRYKIMKGITEVVCGSLKTTGLKIKDILEKSEISPRLAFVGMIKSLSRPKSTTLEKEDLDRDFLKKSSFFKSFSKDEFEELLKYMHVVKAAKKSVLIKEREKQASFYVILRGAVQININQGNKAAKLGVLGPMSLFCNIIYIDANPSMVSHVACEDVVLLKIDSKHLEHLKKENIQLWYKMYDKICYYIVNLEKFSYKFFIRLSSEFYNRS
jgi:CRP/FNR family transcriptional regulator, cyclic AMP receptor protein